MKTRPQQEKIILAVRRVGAKVHRRRTRSRNGKVGLIHDIIGIGRPGRKRVEERILLAQRLVHQTRAGRRSRMTLPGQREISGNGLGSGCCGRPSQDTPRTLRNWMGWNIDFIERKQPGLNGRQCQNSARRHR